MYDLFGSLSVFGFLTAYALVAIALPFARRTLGKHSGVLAAISVLTVVLIVLVAVFDLQLRGRCGARAHSLYLSRLYCFGTDLVRNPAHNRCKTPMICGKRVPNV